MSAPALPGRAERRAAKRSDADRVPPFKNFVWGASGISWATNIMLLGWLSLYATDSLGLSPATIGFVIAASQVVNAVGTLIASYIVDRSPVTRWGKARPYELAVPLVWLATIGVFATPTSLDPLGRAVWIGVMFVLLNGVFDPFLRSNDTLYMVRSFATRPQWAKVVTTAGFMTMVGVIPFAVVLPMFLNSAGKDPSKWLEVVVVIAVIMTVLGLTRFFLVKEKYGTADDAAPRAQVRDMVAAIRGNRWVWLYTVVPFIVAGVTSANVVGYYWRYIVGDLSLAGVLSIMGVVTLPVLFLMPRLLKRFSVAQLIIVASALGVVGNAIAALAWGNIGVLLVGSLIAAIGILPGAYIAPLMILDLCSYNEWKGHRRLESTIGALGSIFSKLGAAAVAGFAGVLLTVAGYDGGLDQQNASALQAINFLAFWMPAVLFVALIIAMLVYNRFDNSIMPPIRAELSDRQIAADAEMGEDLDDALLAGAPTPPVQTGPASNDGSATR